MRVFATTSGISECYFISLFWLTTMIKQQNQIRSFMYKIHFLGLDSLFPVLV